MVQVDGTDSRVQLRKGLSIPSPQGAVEDKTGDEYTPELLKLLESWCDGSVISSVSFCRNSSPSVSIQFRLIERVLC